MKKQFFALFMSAVLMGSLTACNSSAPEATTAAATEAETKEGAEAGGKAVS